MRNYYLFIIILFFCSLSMNAQFSCDFEDCEGEGLPSPCLPWTNWGCGGGPGCDIVCSSAYAHSGEFSGLIPGDGTTDAVLDLGNKIFGEWALSFWMYIPSNKEAYFNLQGVVPIGAGEWIVGNIFFNQDLASPGVGLIDDSFLGAVTFNFPHDQWFNITMNWDITTGISAATWQMCVDGTEVIPVGTLFTNSSQDPVTSLGGIDFFSISANNEYYVDDFEYVNGSLSCVLGVNEVNEVTFSIYPNPTKDILQIAIDEPIKNVSIFTLQGRLVNQYKNSTINISNLQTGLYFIEIETENGKGVQKFIKE